MYGHVGDQLAGQCGNAQAVASDCRGGWLLGIAVEENGSWIGASLDGLRGLPHSPRQGFYIEVHGPGREVNVIATQCIRGTVDFRQRQRIYHACISARLTATNAAHKQRYDDYQTHAGGELGQRRHRIGHKVAASIQECEDQRRRVIADGPHDRQL